MRNFFRFSEIRRFVFFCTLSVVGAATALAQQAPIIVDHTSVAQFDTIPDEWLERAKELTIHFGHTSHGSQIIAGLEVLERFNPKYSFARRISADSAGLPPLESPPALRMYDGNPPDIYVTPDDYWDGEAALNRTRSVVSTGAYSISMWSWCGQQSENTTAKVDQYLAAMETLEREFPGTTFIYMTGHLDGGSATLKRNNDRVREYVKANGKVLFDFADIENWDLDGNFYANGSDACEWCVNWCRDFPEDCDFSCACSHSNKLNCLIKGKAFWWLMARLAGWGSGNRPPQIIPISDQTVGINQTVSFQVEASDPDGNPLTYSVSNLPAGASFDQNTHEFSWTPAPETEGTHDIVFTVSDNGNPPLSNRITVSITVGEKQNSSKSGGEASCFLSTLFSISNTVIK